MHRCAWRASDHALPSPTKIIDNDDEFFALYDLVRERARHAPADVKRGYLRSIEGQCYRLGLEHAAAQPTGAHCAIGQTEALQRALALAIEQAQREGGRGSLAIDELRRLVGQLAELRRCLAQRQVLSQQLRLAR